MSQQQVPHDNEAECAVLGALLIDPDAMGRVLGTGLRAEHFHQGDLGLVFRAILALHKRGVPADYVLVLSELRRAGHLKRIGGPAALTQLILRCPTSVYAQHYANVVAGCARQRRMIVVAANLAKAAYAGEDADLRTLTDGLRDSPGKLGGVLR